MVGLGMLETHGTIIPRIIIVLSPHIKDTTTECMMTQWLNFFVLNIYMCFWLVQTFRLIWIWGRSNQSLKKWRRQKWAHDILCWKMAKREYIYNICWLWDYTKKWKTFWMKCRWLATIVCILAHFGTWRIIWRYRHQHPSRLTTQYV